MGVPREQGNSVDLASRGKTTVAELAADNHGQAAYSAHGFAVPPGPESRFLSTPEERFWNPFKRSPRSSPGSGRPSDKRRLLQIPLPEEWKVSTLAEQVHLETRRLLLPFSRFVLACSARVSFARHLLLSL
jgi:hypothetical protein